MCDAPVTSGQDHQRSSSAACAQSSTLATDTSRWSAPLSAADNAIECADISRSRTACLASDLSCLCSSAASAEHPSSISDGIVPLSDCHAGGSRFNAAGWHRLDRSHTDLPADIRRSSLGHGYSRCHMRPHRHTLVLDRSWIHLDRPALVSRREWRAISALNDLRKHLSTPELPLFTRTKHVIISTVTLNHERTSLPDHSKPLPMPGLDAGARLSGTRHHWGI